jgi:hypothetical protein
MAFLGGGVEANRGTKLTLDLEFVLCSPACSPVYKAMTRVHMVALCMKKAPKSLIYLEALKVVD